MTPSLSVFLVPKQSLSKERRAPFAAMPHAHSTRLKSWLRKARKLVIMGIGNVDRGDDAIGSRIAEHLVKHASKRLKVINCKQAPEKFIEQVVCEKPTHVLVIDAADFAERPGEVRLIEPGELEAVVSVSTHSIPLSIISEMIRLGTGASILMLGIQSGQTRFGSKMSPKVKKSLSCVVDSLEKALRSVCILN